MPAYWLELSVTAAPEAVEAISEVMSRHATGGVAIEEPYTLLDDGQVAQPLLDAPVTVRVYVPADPGGAEARARIEEGMWHLRQIGSAPSAGAPSAPTGRGGLGQRLEGALPRAAHWASAP